MMTATPLQLRALVDSNAPWYNNMESPPCLSFSIFIRDVWQGVMELHPALSSHCLEPNQVHIQDRRRQERNQKRKLNKLQ